MHTVDSEINTQTHINACTHPVNNVNDHFDSTKIFLLQYLAITNYNYTKNSVISKLY